MLLSDSYFTISGPAEATFRDRGSKFMAYTWPVTTEAEIKAHLQLLKKEHVSASHCCYAWRLGPDKLAFRANDDGEPSGTAGRPIFSQIQSRDLTNILTAVVRYFGGTLLGVNGLINAYKSVAAEALTNAVIQEKFILAEYRAEFGFDSMNVAMRVLKEYEAKIVSTDYSEKNTIVFRIKRRHSEKLENKFGELYTARLECLNLT